MEGQSPEHLGEWTAPLPTLLLSPLSSLLGAHTGLWLPGLTSSLCVLREDQEQDARPQSQLPGSGVTLTALPETVSSLGTKLPSGWELQGRPHPVPVGIDDFG